MAIKLVRIQRAVIARLTLHRHSTRWVDKALHPLRPL